MKHTKENIIYLLKARINNLKALREMYRRENNDEEEKIYYHQVRILEEALATITNKILFEKNYLVFEKDIEELKKEGK